MQPHVTQMHFPSMLHESSNLFENDSSHYGLFTDRKFSKVRLRKRLSLRTAKLNCEEAHRYSLQQFILPLSTIIAQLNVYTQNPAILLAEF